MAAGAAGAAWLAAETDAGAEAMDFGIPDDGAVLLAPAGWNASIRSKVISKPTCALGAMSTSRRPSTAI